MIIRKLPPTAVIAAERVTPGDMIYGRELHDGNWQMFEPPYRVEAVRPHGVRLLIDRHEESRPRGAIAILSVLPDTEVLIAYDPHSLARAFGRGDER